VPPEASSLLANFVLFLAYYYPVRSYLVFKTKQPLVVQAVPAAPLKPTAT